MDTRDLEAQLRSAEAQVQQALQYRTQVQAEIVQRRSELDLADKDLQRALVLVGKHYVSEQKVAQQRNIRRTPQPTLHPAQAKLVPSAPALRSAQRRLVQACVRTFISL